MDIGDLIPRTIESIKERGQVRPTIYAEFTESSRVDAHPLLNFIGDGRAKAHQLFTLGREVGRKAPDRRLREVCFVTEIWLTQGQRNPNPGMRPPTGIPQKEAVMFLTVAAHPPYEQAATIYEIKRTKGKPDELAIFQDNAPMDGLLVQAFVAGWRSRHMSEAEVRALQPQGIRAFLNLSSDP